MPTSAPGNRSVGGRNPGPGRWQRGFTLVELLIVIAIVALAASLVALALPDADAARLDEEGARLSALLEMARAESRVSGAAVHWAPRARDEAGVDKSGRAVHFRFVGLSPGTQLPSHWLDPRVSAQVVGASAVLLGPEAILPAQRIVLSLDQRSIELATDGLGPFAVVEAGR